uniref:Disease resistance R13L4/SHOC-2-like LRR domain-containing protein n=3 Tax=Ciona intestinalis TaxID=7719 RepID=H2Y1A8_CIOIN
MNDGTEQVVPPKKKSVQYPDQHSTKSGKQKKHSKAMAHEMQKRVSKCKDNQDTRLDLSQLDLTSLSTTIKNMTQLCEIFLYQNKLAKVPDELGQLVNLTILALNENHLTSLPASLQNLKQLKMLDLRHNKLREVPQVVYQLQSLRKLYLRFNKITTIDPAIENLSNLTQLIIRENKVREIPS